jgi:hypothetical protein
MATNLHGKKIYIHQDDEVRYVCTPTNQSSNSNLKNILFWASSGEEERTSVNKVGLNRLV